MAVLKYLSGLWTSVAPAVGNHLWQSTLFAVVAGLLTLMLRKNQARARYWIWMAASLKFLVPFSLLVAVGSHIGWARGSDGVESGITLAMDEFSQPFTQPTGPASSHLTSAIASPLSTLLHMLPALLAVLWLLGFAAVLSTWFVRWRGMSAAIRNAVLLDDGREVAALRRMERVRGIRKRIQMCLSHTSLEPGIFGIARPVLVWPDGISTRLGDAHLEAILAHEVGHVRWRDNLFAAIHMLVEAIFWFHPLVWFLGTRLVEEREVACDEEVLALGRERQVYAESILKICEFCVGSPLTCVSGVTGADLKRRIARIMTAGAARKLNFGRKLLLGASGLLAIAVPVVFGLTRAALEQGQSQSQNSIAAMQFKYEIASVKQNKSLSETRPVMNYTDDGYLATNVPLLMLVQSAYGVFDTDRIGGTPTWIGSDRFDIDAKMESTVADELKKLSPSDRNIARQQMLQRLLADRFKLMLHRDMKELPAYSLVVAKNGTRLQESKPGDTYPNGFKDGVGRGGAGTIQLKGRGGLIGQAAQISQLAGMLSWIMGHPVLDKTGLTGKYDFTLQWTPDENEGSATINGSGVAPNGHPSLPPPDANGPSLFTAIQDQMGLKLESKKAPVEIIVIDHVERPSGN